MVDIPLAVVTDSTESALALRDYSWWGDTKARNIWDGRI
jgi:hypothetical protein